MARMVVADEGVQQGTVVVDVAAAEQRLAERTRRREEVLHALQTARARRRRRVRGI